MTQRTYGLTQLLGHGYAFTQRLVVPSPAAATGFTIKPDGNYWSLIDSLSFTLATDSNAANRVVTLSVVDGDGIALATVPANAAVTASKTGVYTFLVNFSGSVGPTDGPFLSVAPAIFLQPQFSIVVASTNLQVGDQFGKIRLYLERFVTGPEGYLMGVVDEQGDLDRLARVAALVG